MWWLRSQKQSPSRRCHLRRKASRDAAERKSQVTGLCRGYHWCAWGQSHCFFDWSRVTILSWEVAAFTVLWLRRAGFCWGVFRLWPLVPLGNWLLQPMFGKPEELTTVRSLAPRFLRWSSCSLFYSPPNVCFLCKVWRFQLYLAGIIWLKHFIFP